MKKKKLITALAITAALTIPVSVFAATSDTTAAKTVRGFLGIDTSKLTDTQKADVTSYKQKLADLQKEFINKMVANGSITKAQGDTEIAKIDEQLKNSDSTYIPGFGGGKGGHGMRGSFGMYGIDTSKLTDAQKADLVAEVKKIADLHKDLITKAVSNSLLTKDQGDSLTKSVDEVMADIQKNGLTNNSRILEGFNCFGIMKGINSSNLTDAQKAIFTNFNTKLAALKKELINKMVSNGALTQEQGTAAINRLDQAAGDGIQMGRGMGKGRFGGRGGMKGDGTLNGSSSGSSSGTTTNSTTGPTS